MTSAAIHTELEAIRDRDHGLRIIHLEEAGSLSRDRCDESLTDLMDDDDFKTCRWFATAVEDTGLDPQFRRRWECKVTTSRPTDLALAKRLAAHCFKLGIEVEHPKILRLLVEQAWGVVGLATAMLSMALIERPHRLTEEMIFDYGFPSEDPWEKVFFQR